MRRQRPSKKRIVLGVTGIFGSGKTTVCGILNSFGADVINADGLVHQFLGRGKNPYKKIVASFGPGILGPGRAIDRKRLGRIVFEDKGSRITLNRILHPLVIREIKKRIKAARKRVIVLDAPLLLEAGLRKMVDKLVVVKISRAEQVKRLKKRGVSSLKDILKRTKIQIPQSRKVGLADFVIDNSGLLRETRRQVREVWKETVRSLAVNK